MPATSSSSPIPFVPRQLQIMANKTSAKESKARDMLLASIASFLDSCGYRKTLKALQSEAKLESDCWKSASLNLENQFYKILELSTSQAKASDDSQKEKGLVNNVKDLEEKDTHEKTKEKKRKKKTVSDSLAGNAEDKHLDADTVGSDSIDLENHSQKPQENKEKKKKKHKLADTSNPHTEAEDGDAGKFQEVTKSSKDELTSMSKTLSASEEKVEKKKKKSSKDVELETSDHATEHQGKKEKKKKSKQSSEGLSSTNGSEEGKSNDQMARHDENKETGKSNSEVMADEISKSSKKRKRSSSENDGTDKDVNPDKKRNEHTEKSSPETPVGNKTANGSTDANSSEGGTLSKSKKENQSTERKSSVPFQRVKVEEVEFVDDRLQDNSYWAKSGADSGYGAKAQEVLGQVKGRDFRHEKTKKKRGSYRGGQIDLHSHSIKFNYSDEE